MRRDLLRRLQRVLFLISLFLFLAIGLLAAQAAGYALPSPAMWFPPEPAAQPPRIQVALISGHAGFDSGAVCTGENGAAALTEAEVNARVAQRVAALLADQGVEAVVLEEYDARLDGLVADVLLSLHADSCVDYSGYKAATRQVSLVADQEERLLACIDQAYPAATGLAYHPFTVTRDMIGYHAFRKIAPSTPAAILEMGFLGGDKALLTNHVDRVAQGVVESLRCFLSAR